MTSKINLYLIDYYSPLQHNGLNTYIRELTDKLSHYSNINLHMIWVNAKNGKEIFYNEEDKSFLVPFDINTSQEKDTLLKEYLKSHIKENENILFHFNWINHAPFAQFLKKEIPCKTLLTKHCVPYRDFIDKKYPLFYSINKAYVKENKIPFSLKNTLSREFVSYNSVDHIITVTNDAKKVLENIFDINPSKISNIYNGIETSTFSYLEKKENLRDKYGFSQTDKIILFAGKLSKNKGILDLIQSFHLLKESHPSAHLIICGLGNYDLIFSKIKKNYASITLTGNIDKKQLYEFYRMADVGIVPSHTEQCSYTMIEMMASNLPIIVSPVGGLDEIINEDLGYKTKINIQEESLHLNTEDLSQKITHVFENKEEAKLKASQAFDFMNKHLISEKMTSKTVAVYEKLLSNKSSITLKNQENKLYEELVSIILPCYNAEKFIRESIESIITQTYKNWELIVIDDGSKDSTSKIIQAFQDPRIKYFKNNKNLGIVKSLNKGIKKAKGKYIARMDADDIMHPDRIQKQIDFFNKNSEYAIIGSNHELIDSYGNTKSYYFYPETNEEIQIFKYFLNPFSHPSIMFKKSILMENPYKSAYTATEDYNLWINLLKDFKAYNIPLFLTQYRIHGNNLSLKNNKEQRENMLELSIDELERNLKNLSLEEIKTHSALINRLGNKYFNSEEKISKLDNWIKKIILTEFPKMDKSKIGKYLYLIKSLHGI